MQEIEQLFIMGLVAKHPNSCIDTIIQIYQEIYNTCYKCRNRNVSLDRDSECKLYYVKCEDCGYERCVDLPKANPNSEDEEHTNIKVINKTNRPLTCCLTYSGISEFLANTASGEVVKIKDSEVVLTHITIDDE